MRHESNTAGVAASGPAMDLLSSPWIISDSARWGRGWPGSSLRLLMLHCVTGRSTADVNVIATRDENGLIVRGRDDAIIFIQ